MSSSILGFLLGVLLGVVAAEVDADVMGSGHTKATVILAALEPELRRRSRRVKTEMSKIVCRLRPWSDNIDQISAFATPFLSAHLLWEFPCLAYGTLWNVAIVIRWSSGAVRIRLKFRKCEVNWRV